MCIRIKAERSGTGRGVAERSRRGGVEGRSGDVRVSEGVEGGRQRGGRRGVQVFVLIKRKAQRRGEQICWPEMQ